jgi:hypothetical protein
VTYKELHSILDYNEITGIFTWKMQVSNKIKVGNTAGILDRGYIRIGIGGKIYYAHRLAWLYVYGEWPELLIDHIDGNKSNNAIDNLREATKSQNMQNRGVQKNNKSCTKIPGVSYDTKNNKYQVYLHINNCSKFFGYFSSIKDAEEECIKQRRIHYKFNTL